ncbi:hypothetical protein A9Q89_00785 [Gammaproteobacteria bacterium 53_120_T64]|nr:hypothetical protein A9Q89_00785 [Gammaproteobacteria bacterium 53_120_T64]
MRVFNREIQTGYGRGHLFGLALLLFGQLLIPGHALSSGLLIIYPNVKAPYNKIYRSIIKGIEENYPASIKEFRLESRNDNNRLKQKIEQYQPNVIMTLGKLSLKKARQLDLKVPIVAGAITNTETPVIGVSMTPDPEIILSNLLTIAPFIKRVFVVANTDRQQQIDRAKSFLARRGKTLQSEEVSSVQQAADKYLAIINLASPSDAIWLMRGAHLNDPSILMLVMEAAWKKKIVVFSSNPTHVKRGVLFSVYPDNFRMGGALGELARHHEKLPSIPRTRLLPLKNVHLIVNERTSKHLGIMPNDIGGLHIHRLL